jgi:hypothetical protein
VSVYRQSLVLNAAPETLDRITALLGELDRPLRNLRIGVRKAAAQDGEARGDEGSTRISTRTRASATEIRALESTPLLLQEGNLVPLPQGGLLGPAIRWEELQGGVALSVRLSAECLKLTLAICLVTLLWHSLNVSRTKFINVVYQVHTAATVFLTLHTIHFQ